MSAAGWLAIWLACQILLPPKPTVVASEAIASGALLVVGFDLAQGYLPGHPMPERRFIAECLMPTAQTRADSLSAML